MKSNLQPNLPLIEVAMGRSPADLLVRNGTWVCVQSGEFIPGTDVAVKDGRIAYVGPDGSHTRGRGTRVIEAHGMYLVPGLLDGHLHVESGMLTVTEYVRAVLPHGTTGLFIDPHEIANVFGLKGVRWMAGEAARQPIHVYVQIPSCVPSSPDLETPGMALSPQDVFKALGWKNVIGLGEVMNYDGVAAGDGKMMAEIDATRSTGKVVGGHYASPDLGMPFHGYVAGGIEDDHEGTRREDAVARVRQGMKAMLRYSSAWHDVAAQSEAVTRDGLDSRHFLLCGDDSHAGTLVDDGHMDRAIRHAIDEGLPPMTAIQMATINTAEHFGLSREIGMIAPGRQADLLLVKDLANFRPELVLVGGQLAVSRGQVLIELPAQKFPAWLTHSVRLKQPLMAEDFRLRTEVKARRVKCNVIGVIENQAPTRHLHRNLPVKDGQVLLEEDVAKVAVVERHHASGIVQLGLVSGFGLGGNCGIASTVAHDCHHMLVIGTSEADMALAANTLARSGGGQVVVKDGNVIGEIELAIGGLMSTGQAEQVARKAETILAGFRQCGCRLNNANMTMSLLALVVIPELRLSDRGLVDVRRQAFIPVFENPES